MIEYNKREVYTFTSNGIVFNYFTINESDPYGDIIRNMTHEKMYFGKVDRVSGSVRLWSDRFGSGEGMNLDIDNFVTIAAQCFGDALSIGSKLLQ